MFEVVARDGAGRMARWQPQPGQAVDTPAVLWVADELGPDTADWQPKVGRGPGSFLVNTFSIQHDVEADQVAGGGLVLRRRLEVPATMTADAQLVRRVGELAVMTGALNLARNPKRFAPALVRAREAAGYAAPLYVPGLGEPNDVALLVYAGADVVDSVAPSMAAAQGRFLTSDGSFVAAHLPEAECLCDGCAGQAPGELDEARLRWHNQWALRTEMARVRNALRGGRLRELVEARVRSHPERTALLRRLDAMHSFFEERAPVESVAPVLANTKESLRRAEVARFRQRLVNRYPTPETARILVLLPCSARKPYGTSQSHRKFADAIWASGAQSQVEEWIVTSPLGVVPRALERTYPAAHYDVPVTGEWDEEEGAMIRATLAALLAKHEWKTIVAHLPQATADLVMPVLPDHAKFTCLNGGPTRNDNLTRLTKVLREVAGDAKRPGLNRMLAGRVATLAAYQFGAEAAARLLEGTQVRGKWPGAKVFAEGVQLASFPINKGTLSLTLDGAKRLLAIEGSRVEIQDFPVKGSVFAVGVTAADASIRVGDEVVVHHAGRLKGVGVAAMSGPEMVAMSRGEAVKVRHHV